MLTFSEPPWYSGISDESDNSELVQQLSGEHSTRDLLHDGPGQSGPHQQQSHGDSLDSERFESFR